MEGLETGLRLGNKQLSTVDCVAQSLAVGPVFSAALLGSILAGLTGGVGPFTLILTLIGILGIGWTVSEFAKRYAGSGTVYEFIEKSLGQRAAVFTAGSYYLGVLALTAVGIPLVGGMLIHAFLNNHMGIGVPWWIWSLVVLGIITLVNNLGVEMSVRTQLVVIVLSLIPFAILAMKVIIDGGVAGNNLDSFNPANVAEGGSVFKGLLFAILMFVGFELAAALGEETAHPKRSIPRAVMATILIVFSVYVVTQYALAIGSDGDTIPPFFEVMAEVYVGRWLLFWIEIAIMLDMLAVGIGFALAGARGMFTLSRDGLLPASLSKLNSRSQPVNGNLVVLVVGIIGVFITFLVYGTEPFLDENGVQLFPVPEKAFYALLICSTIGAMIICTTYVLLCLGALKTFATKRPIDLIAAVLGLGIAVLGIAAQFIEGTAPTDDAKWGVWIAVACLVIAGVWAALSRKEAVAKVGQHTLTH
jgi:amino acid transporter